MTPPTERRRSYDVKLEVMHIDIKHTKGKVDKLDEKVDDLNTDLHKIDKKVAVLEVKAGLWGTLAGGLAGFGVWLWSQLRG